jgi:hypothetical protein
MQADQVMGLLAMQAQSGCNGLQQLHAVSRPAEKQLTLFLTLLMQVCNSDLIVVKGTWVTEGSYNVMHLQSVVGWGRLQLHGPHISAQVCYARLSTEVLCLEAFWMQPNGCS